MNEFSEEEIKELRKKERVREVLRVIGVIVGLLILLAVAVWSALEHNIPMTALFFCLCGAMLATVAFMVNK